MKVGNCLAAMMSVMVGTVCADLEKVSLNGLWDFAFAREAALESAAVDFTATDKMVVPGCFDLVQKWYAQRGLAHYRRSFVLDADVRNAFLVVKGMGLQAKFYLDGKEFKKIALPYLTFEVELGALAAGRHELVCALDNNLTGAPELVFRPNYDFFLSGGFYHGVELKLQRKAVELDRAVVRTRDYASGLVELTLEAKGALPQSFTAAVSFDGGTPMDVRFEHARAKLNVPAFKLWSPDAPNLHRVKVSSSEFGEVVTRFGIREFKTKGRDFLLNGTWVWLKGVNRHESHPENGPATTVQTMYRDVLLMKSIGCNYVRGAHYPQCEEFLDLCDELGLMVWEESLGWGNRAEMGNAQFVASQVEQTRAMVRNSINHPSIVISGFMNECDSKTDAAKALVEALARTIRAEDSGHLVTFACNNVKQEKCGAYVDFIAMNLYPSWHQKQGRGSTPATLAAVIKEQFDESIEAVRKRYGNDKPIIIGETGCYSIYGEHDPMGAQWSEEFQSEYLDHWLALTTKSPEMSGFTVWQFCDSRTYFRGGGDIRTKPMAYNMAGLFDRLRRTKLSALTVRKYYTEKK